MAEPLIAAGLGCRRGVTRAAVLALLQRAAATARPALLAAPAFKCDEPALVEAAAVLGLPLRCIDAAALAAVQGATQSRSDAALRATGFAAIAEAAALAALAPGARLILPRITGDGVTCALAEGMPR